MQKLILTLNDNVLMLAHDEVKSPSWTKSKEDFMVIWNKLIQHTL